LWCLVRGVVVVIQLGPGQRIVDGAAPEWELEPEAEVPSEPDPDER